ncbi:MAG: hypothetical protein Q8K75_03000 [Chlamydiales bacterium]|nr:hypothetical protein [Chlamydiales bacterium]
MKQDQQEPEQEVEDRASSLRHEAQEKLEEAREKLMQAKKDLENTADIASPKRNPFGKKTASLKAHATELQAAQIPTFPKSPPRSNREPEVEPPDESVPLDLDGSE